MYYFRSDLEKKEKVKVEVPHKRLMLSLNEGVLNPLAIMGESFFEKLQSVSLNRYFNSVTQELTTALKNYIGNNVSEKQFLMGNGADQMLYYTFLSLRDNADDFALSLTPSYFDYQSYCSAVGLGFKTLTLDNNFDFNPEELLAAADNPNCRLIIICYPNNPTGNLFSEEKILDVISRAKVPVLVDETYYEFSGKSLVHYLPKHDNLIIVRSFSKAFAAAGVRFGYLISSEQNIREIDKVFPAFNLSMLIQAFALELINKSEEFRSLTQKIIKQRDIVFNQIESIPGMTVYSSETNFLIFSYGEKTLKLHDYLSKNEISVRSMHKLPLLENHLRVTISSENDNHFFIECLKQFTELNK